MTKDTCSSTREAEAYLREKGWRADHATVSRAVKAGKIVRDSSGALKIPSLETWALAYCKRLDLSNGQEQAAALAQEKAQAETALLKWKAEREELKLRQERGELVERAAAEEQWVGIVLVLRSRLETLAHELPVEILGEDWNVETLQAHLLDRVQGALDELAATPKWRVTLPLGVTVHPDRREGDT